MDSNKAMMGLFTGLMQGRAKKRQMEQEREDKQSARKLQDQMLKLQIQQAKIKQQESSMKSMLLERLMGQIGQPGAQPAQPGASKATPMGESMGAGPGVVDQLANMDPMQQALLKSLSGVDVLGAGRLSEQQASRKQRAFADDRRDADRDRGYNFDREKFAWEKGKIAHIPATENGVPVLRPVNAATKEPAGPSIPVGAMKGMPAESAGKMAMAHNAKAYIKTLREMILPGGEVDKSIIFQMAAPGGGVGKGREAMALFGDAVDARIRAATGAAVSKEDWELYKRTYLPSPMDLTSGPDAIKKKLDRFEDFINSYLKTIDPGGVFQRKLDGDPAEMDADALIKKYGG